MQLKNLYIVLLCIITLIGDNTSVAANTSQIKCITSQTEYEAGTPIVLEFETKYSTNKNLLYCSNSYGTTLISPAFKTNILSYTLPSILTTKRGTINWTLITKNKTLSGTITIHPKQHVKTLETYVGPPSIEAGGKDYTMLVVIPTDSLDNPLPENTPILAKHQFLEAVNNDIIYVKNLIAYKTIFSTLKSGRMLIASESLGENSKEFTVDVMPAIPKDFDIFIKRAHNYADGNQITTFYTSELKDRYKNTVSDGTFVDFFIEDGKGNRLKTSSTTIKGIAQSKIIHPDYEDHWRVKAYVHGIAESNTLNIDYTQVITDFNISFLKHNREIQVGPLQSFMKQMIPDGLQVTLSVYKDNVEVFKRIETTFNGYANFNLKPEFLKNGTYTIHIKTAGITKSKNNIALW